MYSIMLYMTDRKHRVTFRVAKELAVAMRKLPNQTAFVEDAIREALGRSCPLCKGRGRVAPHELAVSDFKRAGLPRLRRDAALRLREVVRLGRRLSATELRLATGGEGLAFELARKGDLLVTGAIGREVTLGGV
jgi:hypothetical protein